MSPFSLIKKDLILLNFYVYSDNFFKLFSLKSETGLPLLFVHLYSIDSNEKNLITWNRADRGFLYNVPYRSSQAG